MPEQAVPKTPEQGPKDPRSAMSPLRISPPTSPLAEEALRYYDTPHAPQSEKPAPSFWRSRCWAGLYPLHLQMHGGG